MIKEEKLIPEYYINRIPYCDDCNVRLIDTGRRLLSSPLQWSMKCPNCNKFYHINETELESEWVWKKN